MIRTDIHAPTQIVTEDYRFVACDYYGQHGAEMYSHDRTEFRADMDRTGGKFSNHDHGGSCHICGASALLVAKFHHEKTNTYIVTGLDCATKLEMGDAVAFRSFRIRVAAGRELAKGKHKAQGVLAGAGLSAAWDIYTAVYTAANADGARWEENTLADIVGKLVQYGSISTKQMSFIGGLLVKIAGRAGIDAQRAVAKAASQHVGTVGERREFRLTVKAVPSFDTQFGTMHVHICADEAGNIVVYKGKSIASKGETLTLTATVKAHGERDGEKQTVIARPAVIAVQK